MRPKRLRPAVHRPGAPEPDAVADYRACTAALAPRRCTCGGTGCRERVSQDGTHTIYTRCSCGADPHAAALAEWVDQ